MKEKVLIEKKGNTGPGFFKRCATDKTEEVDGGRNDESPGKYSVLVIQV